MNAVELDTEVRIRMRDGVSLAADLYLPRARSGVLPTILIRTPYGRAVWRDSGLPARGQARLFARHGFAVVVQDVRGKHGSEGLFRIYVHERDDGFDTLDWIVAQPWSNGRVGTYGCSYLGEVQILLAAERHPAHRAIVASGSGDAAGGFGVREGGAVNLADCVYWFCGPGTVDPELTDPQFDLDLAVETLPVQDIPELFGAPRSDFRNVVTSDVGDGWWTEACRAITVADRFDVPALLIDSWYDSSTASTLALSDRLGRESVSERARANQLAIVAPTEHCAYYGLSDGTIIGELEVGDPSYDYKNLYLRWFRHWLNQESPGTFEHARYTYYAIGPNAWRTSATWPPADLAEQALYLVAASRCDSSPRGTLQTAPPEADGELAFVSDPADPCRSRGGFSLAGEKVGPADRRDLLARDDVMLFTGETLAHPVDLVGAPTVTLFVAVDATDADLSVKLVDLEAQGRVLATTEAYLRLSHRHSLADRTLLVPGLITEVTVSLYPITHRFARGHRIGLLIAGSDFPSHDRNLHASWPNAAATVGSPVRITLHYGPARAATLLLPVAAQPGEGRQRAHP